MLINPSQSSQRKASFPAGNTDRFTEKKKKRNTNLYIQTAPKKLLCFYYLKQGF